MLSKATTEEQNALEDRLTATEIALQNIRRSLDVQNCLAADMKARLGSLFSKDHNVSGVQLIQLRI